MPEVSLKILPDPYRGTVRPVVRYVRSLRDKTGPSAIINVILPEFIVPTRLGHMLHNQTGLALKTGARHCRNRLTLAPSPNCGGVYGASARRELIIEERALIGETGGVVSSTIGSWCP